VSRLLLLALLLGGCRFDGSGTGVGREDGAARRDAARDARPPDARSDARPADHPAPAPDHPLLPDLVPPLCNGVTCPADRPICCDRGLGLACQASAWDCRCEPASGAPCAGSYPVCCEASLSSPRCAATADYCRCDAASGAPCGGAYPVCCDHGFGGSLRCYETSRDCNCELTSNAPCSGKYPLCCASLLSTYCSDHCY